MSCNRPTFLLPAPGTVARCVNVCACVRMFVCSFVNMGWGRISRKWLEIEAWLHTAYGESNGNVTDDVRWPVAGGRRCARLAEIAVSDCLSSYYCPSNFVYGQPVTINFGKSTLQKTFSTSFTQTWSRSHQWSMVIKRTLLHSSLVLETHQSIVCYHSNK